MKRPTKAHLLLAAVTFIWGATFVLIKEALDDVSPLLFNAIRFVVASAALALMYARVMKGASRATWLSGSVVGVLLWLGYEFQTVGLVYTTPSKSAFITGLYVLFVPLMLAIGLRRMVSRWTAVGVAAALAGLYLLTVPAGSAVLHGVNRGDLLTIGCAASFALHIILLGRATARYDFRQIAVLQTVIATALMLVSIPLMEEPRIVWSATVIWAILICGILATAVAFGIQAWAQQFTPPTHTALIFSLEPVFAALTSFVVVGERLGWRGGFGALLIVTGVLTSELKGSAATTPEQARANLEPASD